MWKKQTNSRTRPATSRKTKSARSDVRLKLSESKLRERRKLIRRAKSAFVLVLATFIVTGLSWVSYLDTFRVQEIVVEGTTHLSSSAIEAEMLQATAGAALGLFSRQNVLLYPYHSLETALPETFPRIETIDVRTEPIQQRATVTITEREPYAQWCRGREINRVCYRTDRRGFIFERMAHEDAQTLLFEGGVGAEEPLRVRVAPQYFVRVVNLIDDLAHDDHIVEEVHFRGSDVTVHMRTGWKLYVAADKDLGATVFNLRAVLDNHGLQKRLSDMAYIDMRFDERVYYKLFEE